jgi:hypothetical protein
MSADGISIAIPPDVPARKISIVVNGHEVAYIGRDDGIHIHGYVDRWYKWSLCAQLWWYLTIGRIK